jgi:hypothetical protein
MRVQRGNTCLHKACEGGDLEVVKHLCEVGGEALVLKANKVRLSH